MPDRYKSEHDLIRRKLRGIFEHRYTHLQDLTVTGWKTKEPVPFSERMTGQPIAVSVGDSWGELWDCAWFHVTGKVPEAGKGQHVILRLDFSGEACVFDEQGTPVQGLTLAREHRDGEMLGSEEKSIVSVSTCSAGDEGIDLWVDAGCNDLFGHYKNNGKLARASISILHPEMNQLYYDFHILRSLMEQLPESSAQRQSIFQSLLKACYLLKLFTEEEAGKARDILKKELDKKGGDPSLSFSAIGHAHLDLAWLWPIRESRRKAARTFASALRFMEQYPDYYFGQSQPQQFAWIKEEHPALYEQIKLRVAEGRLEVQGGMWVEADTNVSGGEALVRQFLYGKRFFKQEFDKDIPVLWLPDVFGYSAALPQILRKSGIEYFMTIKLSWSKINEFPYHTFNWQGIDGSQVLAHMPPEGNYDSWATPANLTHAERSFHEKGISEEALLLYGTCDGGGGPGEDHLETMKRVANLNGLSPVRQEPALHFFQRIARKKEEYPVWHGELYLEFHQGTYTSQARSKQYNRKLELSLREAEFAAVLANVLTGQPYPKQELDTIWKEVLLYQFHDILPGSSIKRVYDESILRYMELHNEVTALIQTAYTKIASRLIAESDDKDIVLFNSLSWNRTVWQETVTGWTKVEIPAMGYALLGVGEAGEQHLEFNAMTAQEGILENEYLKVELNAQGQICSVLDKEAGREAIALGDTANRMAVYHDPGDAWDFSLQYREEYLGDFILQSIAYRVEGPNAIAELSLSFGDSVMQQRVILQSGSRQVEIQCFVDWQETHKMLRAEFPLHVYTDTVTCNIQYGNVSRPTHTSTSWDYAKYEICAHKWVDLSNKGYGVAILNDCKYGYGVFGNVVSMNLLRSSSHPGEDADKGAQVFSYAIYPHSGDHIAGKVDQKAYEFNIQPAVIQLDTSLPKETDLPNSLAYLSLASEGDCVMMEAVKQAEDSKAIVVRLYEFTGAETKAVLRLDSQIQVKSAWLTDLMEQKIREIPVSNQQLELCFSPFEIHTVMLEV